MGDLDLTDRASFRTWAMDKLRFGDTDLVGHVNNAAFATFFETGRVSFLYDKEEPFAPAGCDFVVVKLTIEFRAEMHYPGIVDIGTRVVRIGTSSFTMAQGLFNEGHCAATAESVCVIISKETRRPVPLPDHTRSRLLNL
jgi:acyl-CoA thioester hydrolase